MDWLDYRDVLGIGFSDYDKVRFFMTKIFNLIDDDSDSTRNQISGDEYFRFCNTTGSKYLQIYPGDGYSEILKILKANSQSLQNFLAYYIAFVNCQEDNQYKRMKRENYKNILCNMLYESHISYDLKEDKDGYFVFPRGAKELDDALVSQPLEWLKDYPSARIAWIKVLKDYSDATEETASDVADKFRKALEAFFQEFFGGQKSLENYKSDYGKYLKEQGVPKEISGNFETLLQSYTQYINSYAKHRNATSDKVLEYIMYQTGNIIRLLITLKQEEQADAD